MILNNLNALGSAIQENIKNYDNKELILSDNFKKEFESYLISNSKDKIEFLKFTSIVTTPKGLKVIFPNQWFYIASFFSDFLNSLWKYKGFVNELNLTEETIKNLRKDPISTDLKSIIQAKISDEYDYTYFELFLTNYDWWYGSKTIDRGDFFVSSVLNLAKVVNVSHSYLADLAYFFSKEQQLTDLLVNDYNNFIGEASAQKINLKSPLQKTEQIIYYGAPGTGKSYKVEQILKTIDSHFYERITFHPEFDNASFVGGYRPVSQEVTYLDSKNEEYTKHEVHYKFVPQAFANIYVKAWNDLDNQYYLAIEEINRGNCAEIFGDIFQLLDRKSNYTVSASNELKEHLNKFLKNKDGISNGLKLPPNLSIYATMNTSDQSLFPMDSAFKRRWNWEYIPICYDDVPENESFEYKVEIDETTYFKWIDFIKNVNAVIKSNQNLGMDKCIGNYFIKSDSKEITLNDFVNKAIFYLWNDVFKDEDSSDSVFEKGTSYEDFFPVNISGKNEVIKILEALKIGTIVKATI
jgi:MoxR-like ATPase